MCAHGNNFAKIVQLCETEHLIKHEFVFRVDNEAC